MRRLLEVLYSVSVALAAVFMCAIGLLIPFQTIGRPMPGLLVSVAVRAGQEVKAGELAVVEAMKMENTLRAVRDGVVAQVFAKPGQSLAVDEMILELE